MSTVGEKIKKIRKDRGMSISELSKSAGVNKKLIKEIEEGNILPSLSPLIKISRALGVRLGTFLDDEIQEGPIIVRKGKSSKVMHFSGEEDRVDKSHLEFHSLGMGKADRHMEPFVIYVDLPPKNFKLSSHEGEEFIYVLNGEIEVIYGKNKYRLSEGDSIYYDSIVPHHVHSAGNKPAKILAVLYTPF